MNPTKQTRKWLFFVPLAAGIGIFVVLTNRGEPPEQRASEPPARVVRTIEAPLVTEVPRALGYGRVKPERVCEAVAKATSLPPKPHWRLIENTPVTKGIWPPVSQLQFARRRIFDARIAFTQPHHGVTDLATTNREDFEDFGFTGFWNPLVKGPEGPLGT